VSVGRRLLAAPAHGAAARNATGAARKAAPQEATMKRSILAVVLAAAAAGAWAQTADEPLAPVIVARANGARIIVDCAPPNYSADCSYFHELIRENFTPHEIALLFGPATPQLDYRTNYDRVQERYTLFLQDIADNGLPVAAGYTYYDEP
jgi:hypothetical protein